MPAILSKNCIVGGELDWYCLACCLLLPAAEDAVAHIQAAAHKHNLTELPYADTYAADSIRKARDVYYCEVCNVTFPTAAKVGMHVTEATHVAGMTGRHLKRAGNAIVFQENTLVTESAWNGLVDDTCVLCNVEFDDESTHKSQQNHILNLINSSVTAATRAANEIYRKIDGGRQCLTCNKVVPEGGITEHLNSEQHKSPFVSYNQNEANDVKSDDVANKESKDDDTTSNTELNGADVKTLCTTPVLMKDKNIAVCSSDDTEVKTLAKQHGLSVNKGSSGVYCSACSVHVTATLDRINEHVRGKKHKRNLAKKSQVNVQNTKNIKKVPMKDFLFHIAKTQETLSGAVLVILNYEIFLYFHKFLGLGIKDDERLVCLFCDIDLTKDNVDEHLSSSSHLNVLKKCLVISSIKEEFVREVRQDLYHCGYCGTVEHNLNDMTDHLDTEEHKMCKSDLFDELQIFKMQRILAAANTCVIG